MEHGVSSLVLGNWVSNWACSQDGDARGKRAEDFVVLDQRVYVMSDCSWSFKALHAVCDGSKMKKNEGEIRRGKA